MTTCDHLRNEYDDTECKWCVYEQSLERQLENARAEVNELRRVIKHVDELADTQPSYWVVSIIRATQAALKRAIP